MTCAKRKPFLIIKHIAVEGPGVFGQILQERGWGYHELEPGAPLPAPKELALYAGLLLLGGPMSVYQEDEFPFLVPENELLQAAIKSKMPVLGICLGAQLIAKALGARVFAGPVLEIGWSQVHLTPAAGKDPLFKGLPAPMTVLQWHGDTFDLPAGAVCLASSAQYSHQAFVYGTRVYALQYHLEVTDSMIASWLTCHQADLQRACEQGVLSPDAVRQMPTLHLEQVGRQARSFFNAFLELAL